VCGLEWIHVAQDTVLWYNLCEYINERMRISSLAEQSQTSKQRRCSMQFIKVPFHFVLCTLLSVPHRNYGLWVALDQVKPCLCGTSVLEHSSYSLQQGCLLACLLVFADI